MVYALNEDLFIKIKELMKNRNITIYKELEKLEPLETIKGLSPIQQARKIKTQRVKKTIKETIKKLLSEDISPTKYQVNKLSKISFITLNKYFDDILEEVENKIN